MFEMSIQEYNRLRETKRIAKEHKFKETALSIHKTISRIEYLTNQVKTSNPNCAIDDDIISCDVVHKMIDEKMIELINLNKQLIEYI